MSDLQTSVLGRTDAEVTKLGFGAMELRPDLGEDAITALLNDVLDVGITMIDTSPDYGQSEEFIGAAISHRRDEYFLASKCGCQVDPPPPARGFPEHVFTRHNVRAGVEQSLRRMRTDHVDLVQVHMSPPRSVLEDHDVIAEMQALRDEGKVRFLGMSGTLPNLPDHIDMGVFDAFQIPYSALEREHEQLVTDAARAGAGTIIRGGVARGVPEALPAGYDRLPEEMRTSLEGALEARKARWAAAEADLDDLLDGMPRMEFLLRFTLSHPDLHTTIVGTSSRAHLADNVAVARKGPLPTDVYEAAREKLGSAGGQ
jgi:aryl-alcohol dehydrogenase-like predicted oxidoreductase